MRYSKIREVRSPNRGTSNSAGIPSGIKVDIPNGTMLQVCNKSGIASKKGLLVGACIVDSDYQGEMHLNLWNVSNKAVTLASGTKLVQMILVPILLPELEEVLEGDLFVGETERGTGGFGSTGV